MEVEHSSLKRDNESLLDSLHKEQDKSYKLLRDLHQSMQESKQLKQQSEDMRLEIDQLRGQLARAQEVDRENSRMQQEIIRMQSYIGEQEVMIEQHRERLREGERSMGMQVEQGRHMEAALEKARQDC